MIDFDMRGYLSYLFDRQGRISPINCKHFASDLKSLLLSNNCDDWILSAYIKQESPSVLIIFFVRFIESKIGLVFPNILLSNKFILATYSKFYNFFIRTLYDYKYNKLSNVTEISSKRRSGST